MTPMLITADAFSGYKEVKVKVDTLLYYKSRKGLSISWDYRSDLLTLHQLLSW